MHELTAVDFAIEAVTENEALKLEIFRKLDSIVQASAILASNTSSIPITQIASVTPSRESDRHALHEPGAGDEAGGGHPWPCHQRRDLSTTCGLVARLGKEMAVSQDYPGFIVNRVLIPMINEACLRSMKVSRPLRISTRG